MDLTNITSREIPDLIEGFNAAKKGRPLDDTESAIWQHGWRVFDTFCRRPRPLMTKADVHSPQDIARRIAAALNGEAY